MSWRSEQELDGDNSIATNNLGRGKKVVKAGMLLISGSWGGNLMTLGRDKER